MAKQTNKTVGVIATVLSALFCGCFSLIACIFGAIGIAGVPFNTNINGVEGVETMSTGLAIGLLCLAVIFIAVPIVVGILTLRKKKEPAVTELPPSEPLPPAA